MTTQVNIYPSPFTTTLSMEVVVEDHISAIVQMLDDKQKIVKMMRWNLKKGTNKTTLDNLDSLLAGEYYVNIKKTEGEILFHTKLAKI